MKLELFKNIYNMYKLYIFPVVIVLCCLMLSVLIIFPQSIQLFNGQKSYTEMTNKVTALQEKETVLAGYSEDDLKSKDLVALTVLPNDKDFTGAIGVLQQTISASGFLIDSVQISQTATAKTAISKGYPITVSATGPKSLIATLISNIENSGRIMRLSTLQIDPSQSADVANISLDMDIYYAPTIASNTQADTPLPILNDQDNQILAKYAASNNSQQAFGSAATNSPRGKVNPFE